MAAEPIGEYLYAGPVTVRTSNFGQGGGKMASPRYARAAPDPLVFNFLTRNAPQRLRA